MDLDALARAQHGVLTRAQALQHGQTAEALRWRLRRGGWSRVHPGVYRVHTGDLGWLGRASAALLRLGDAAALSGLAAAYVLGIDDSAPQVITIAVPHACQRRRVPGTRVTRRRRLDTVVRRGLRVTTPAQTVIDSADAFGVTRQDALARAARAVQRRKVSVAQLVAELSARRTHQHRRALQLALGVIGSGAESGLEVDFHDHVLVAHRLPPMRMAVPDRADGRSIRRDFESAEFGVIAEIDGRIAHGAAERERDSRRDRRAARTGRITLRAGWVDVEFEPCELALDLYGTFVSRGFRGALVACGPGCQAVDRQGGRPEHVRV